jgi:16S rRNA A1518/A1519 N6-dimethyltransferase RsmA/KsgA/DIM1 with predicted DNA glycosylase/AP lyase activity
MLAPRTKLWSTPIEVIDAAINCLSLHENDICYDVGAGDGRFLIRACEITHASTVGIEIDPVRCDSIRNLINENGYNSRCDIICGNALDQDFSNATSFFLYLVPRGLKVVYREIISKIMGKDIKVVTYMAPLPIDQIQPCRVVKVSTSMHPEAQWPLYIYNIRNQN